MGLLCPWHGRTKCRPFFGTPGRAFAPRSWPFATRARTGLNPVWRSVVPRSAVDQGDSLWSLIEPVGPRENSVGRTAAWGRMRPRVGVIGYTPMSKPKLDTQSPKRESHKPLWLMALQVRPEGLEPPTLGSEVSKGSYHAFTTLPQVLIWQGITLSPFFDNASTKCRFLELVGGLVGGILPGNSIFELYFGPGKSEGQGRVVSSILPASM